MELEHRAPALRRRLTIAPMLAVFLATGLAGPSSRDARLIETFSIREIFGVSHPKQIIDFDLPRQIDPTETCMIGPDGREVPFQVLHTGKVAVESGLPAYGSAVWKLCSGRPPDTSQDAVRVVERQAFYEITNGLTGVRVARPDVKRGNQRAPIQGIQYHDGTWTANGPNDLYDARNAPMMPRTMDARFLDRGPLKVVVEVTYTFDRPALEYGGKPLIPGGNGYYRSAIEIQVGQPSILIEDDTDMDLRYHLDVFKGLRPDKARYRGHHSTSVANGYEADRHQYRQWHERQAMDALRDLQYNTPAPSSYTSTAPYIRRMAIWDPWVFDSGWYWQLYNSESGADSNLLGIFAGRASEAMGAAHNGPGIFTAPAGANGSPAAGVTFECNRRAADGRVFPRVRVSWGMFVGTKGQDLGDPYQVQNIGRQMNLHGGINLNKVYRYQTNFEDPPGGYSSLYMSREQTRKIVTRVRADEAYYHHLYDAEPTARLLLEMWRDTSGRKLQDVVKNVTTTARDLLNALVNGDGIYDFRFHYWHGGLEMSRQAVWINSVLTSDLSTPEDKARVKAAAVLFANVLWDSDFVPMFDGHGLNMGTANMPVQQSEYRDLYALLLAHHPMMQGRVESARQNALDNLYHTVSESGAHMAGTHYIGASMGPLLSTLQQSKIAGVVNAFKTEDRLATFAEFYLNLLTPPEPRFGGYRKLISIGDSATESSELHGQLATGFADSNPALSSRLMAAWFQSGAMHSGFHGSTILKIDDSLPPENPRLGSATFPGWCSVLRNSWGTRNETAVWLVDGDFYRDHAHKDNGNLVIYALGAPLSIDWGSMYSPQTPGAFMHSVAVPENTLHAGWSRDNVPLDAGSLRWQRASQEAFESFSASAHARATYEAPNGMRWTRSIYSIHPDENDPLLVVRDRFDGSDAGTARILTLNLMAQGPVETPQGQASPPLHRYFTNGPQELPSAGPVVSLPPGLNRFGFTGQWLIDWDLYTLSSQPTQALIGSWSHNWHPSREQTEFVKANGRPFEEKQYILRIKGTNDFGFLLFPYRKSQRPELAVKMDGPKVIVTRNGSTMTFDDHCYSYTDTHSMILTTYGSDPCEASGMNIQGGPAEVVLEPKHAAITAHGAAGLRAISLPGTWFPKAQIVKHDRRWLLDYSAGQPTTVVLDATKDIQIN